MIPVYHTIIALPVWMVPIRLDILVSFDHHISVIFLQGLDRLDRSLAAAMPSAAATAAAGS